MTDIDVPQRLTRNRLWLGVAVGVALALLLLGFIPPTLRARRLDQDLTRVNARNAELTAALEQTRVALEVARLRGNLGEVLHAANRNNFGEAATRATGFFDGIQAVRSRPQIAATPQRRQTLETILARRDEISADLARADQAVKQKLAEMYMQYGRAVE